MSSTSDPRPADAPGGAVPAPGSGETVADTALTITEAARATGTGRQVIRTRLQAGDFPHADKDTQGFWRIPASDLVDAGLLLPDGDDAPAEARGAGSSPVGGAGRDVTADADHTDPADTDPDVNHGDPADTDPGEADLGDLVARLRLEILELRHRAERAEALYEAECRLSEERARTLETERATIDALYRQLGIAPPEPRAAEKSRVDWQANLRAARARDAQLRAEREREAARRNGRLPGAPRPVDVPDRAGVSRPGEVTVPDGPPAADEPTRRHRWLRR